MKRVLSIVLVLALLFCLAACGDKKEEKNKQIGIDVEYYAKLGQIPETKYALGEKPDKIITDLEEISKHAEEENDGTHSHEGYYNVYEGDERTTIVAPGINYYYLNDQKDKGIDRIISFGTAYEFTAGTVVSEVKKSLSSYGFDSEERALTPDEALMVSASSDCICLEYAFGDNVVLFVFQENVLFATVLYKA